MLATYKLVKTSGSGCTRWVTKIFFEPTSKTHAASVLLRDYYHGLDEDYLKSYNGRMERIQFSRNTLTKWKGMLGGLFCVYCNKKNLEIEYDGMTVSPGNMATLEHLTPVSKGGGVFDLAHIVCACGNCNRKRSNHELDEHLRQRGIDKVAFVKNCNIYLTLEK